MVKNARRWRALVLATTLLLAGCASQTARPEPSDRPMVQDDIFTMSFDRIAYVDGVLQVTVSARVADLVAPVPIAHGEPPICVLLRGEDGKLPPGSQRTSVDVCVHTSLEPGALLNQEAAFPDYSEPPPPPGTYTLEATLEYALLVGNLTENHPHGPMGKLTLTVPVTIP
ncbi:MAG: hypothetical protein ACOYJA_02745 [Christensenellales bacterium]